VVLLAVTPGPGQSIEMETLIPHELAHVMLYRSVGDGYASLPVWLSEGIASLAELYPDPDFDVILKEAKEKNTLVPIAQLCDAFPPDGSSLAYAESQSFVRFLRDTYGTSYLNSLLSDYANGMSCENGVTHTFKTPLGNLDARWRESVLGQNEVEVLLRNMLPYIWLFGLLLLIPLIGFFQRRPEDDETE